MEFLLFLLLIFGVSFLIRMIGAGSTAAVRTVRGQGTYAENMAAQMQGMGALEVRQAEVQLGENGEGPKGVALELKGLLPVDRIINLSFITSVIDVTEEDDAEAVLCELERFQEPNTPAYAFVHSPGRKVEPNQGFVSWSRIGVVFPDLLIPPYGGTRQLSLVVRLVDTDNMPDIELGFGSAAHPGLVAQRTVQYVFEYPGKGYLESAKDTDEARALAIRLGMAIAVADGSFDDSEGNAIKEWVTKIISPFSGSRRESLKGLYNAAMRAAYADAKADRLSLSEVTSRLNEIAEDPQKYEAIELCFDVMAADGVADESEMDTIRRIAEALDLDYKEIETLRDKSLLELNVHLGHQASPETLIGIQEGWSQDQIKEHIRSEFSKWNNRLNNLPEGHERENAQRMLDMLSEARKKYG